MGRLVDRFDAFSLFPSQLLELNTVSFALLWIDALSVLYLWLVVRIDDGR